MYGSICIWFLQIITNPILQYYYYINSLTIYFWQITVFLVIILFTHISSDLRERSILVALICQIKELNFACNVLVRTEWFIFFFFLTEGKRNVRLKVGHHRDIDIPLHKVPVLTRPLNMKACQHWDSNTIQTLTKVICKNKEKLTEIYV